MSSPESPPPQPALLVEHYLAQAGRLSAFLTHELNNQLAAITGYAELLTQRPETAAFSKQLERILTAGDRARELIIDFREATTIVRDRDPMNVGHALRTALKAREYEFKKRNVSVNVEIAPDLPVQMLHPTHVQLALGALLDNAYEALTPFGSGTITVTATPAGEAGTVVEITNVPGGAPPDEPQLWQTSKDPQRHAGVGFTVARWVAEAAGGTCTLTSGPNGQTHARWEVLGAHPEPPAAG